MRRGPITPQLARSEADRIKVLRLFAQKMGISVRKNKYTAVAVDRAELAARVAWQAGMTCRVHVAGAHALARRLGSEGSAWWSLVRFGEIVSSPFHVARQYCSKVA